MCMKGGKIMSNVLKLQTFIAESELDNEVEGLRKSDWSWFNCGFDSTITSWGC